MANDVEKYVTYEEL